MTDLTELALGARQTLAQADTATLLIESLGYVEPDAGSAVLHDRDGSPSFLCDAGSPVTAAAANASAAVLSVPRHDGPGAVIFAGTLAVTGAMTVDDVRVDLVELLITSITVECNGPDGDVLTQLDVPLEVYGRGDPLAGAAAAIRCHTNARHQPELRAFVAARLAVPVGAIAAASIVGLDSLGAELEWIDSAGAHRERIAFAQPVTEPRRLADQLRGRLAQPHRD